jgi:hypothetical protein
MKSLICSDWSARTRRWRQQFYHFVLTFFSHVETLTIIFVGFEECYHNHKVHTGTGLQVMQYHKCLVNRCNLFMCYLGLTVLQTSNFDTGWPLTTVQWPGSQHHIAHIRSWLCEPQRWEPGITCQEGEQDSILLPSGHIWHYILSVNLCILQLVQFAHNHIRGHPFCLYRPIFPSFIFPSFLPFFPFPFLRDLGRNIEGSEQQLWVVHLFSFKC